MTFVNTPNNRLLSLLARVVAHLFYLLLPACAISDAC
jgi:hypothetical protein